MDIVITPDGTRYCLDGEAVDLHHLGQIEIRRGSHAEPTEDGYLTADLSPVGGPALGLFPNRSEKLTTERQWGERNWLNSGATPSQSSNPLERRTACLGYSSGSVTVSRRC